MKAAFLGSADTRLSQILHHNIALFNDFMPANSSVVKKYKKEIFRQLIQHIDNFFGATHRFCGDRLKFLCSNTQK